MHKKSLGSGGVTYPIAYNDDTKMLVEVSEVNDENRSHLICPECKTNFVSVLKHKSPHFKHYKNMKCTGTFESYIHRIVKELFRKVNEIELPELPIDDLHEKHRQKFQLSLNEIVDSKVPFSLRSEFMKGLKNSIIEKTTIAIDNVEIEKVVNTSLGDIRVDVVVHVKNKTIFIEPYFSNKINEEKMEKISAVNIPTISLNLKKFIEFTGNNFQLAELETWLFIETSKNWVHLSDESYDKSLKKYEDYLFEEIEKRKAKIEQHNNNLSKIKTLEQECKTRRKKIDIIEVEIKEIKDKMDKLRNELGINY